MTFNIIFVLSSYFLILSLCTTRSFANDDGACDSPFVKESASTTVFVNFVTDISFSVNPEVLAQEFKIVYNTGYDTNNCNDNTQNNNRLMIAEILPKTITEDNDDAILDMNNIINRFRSSRSKKTYSAKYTKDIFMLENESSSSSSESDTSILITPFYFDITFDLCCNNLNTCAVIESRKDSQTNIFITGTFDNNNIFYCGVPTTEDFRNAFYVVLENKFPNMIDNILEVIEFSSDTTNRDDTLSPFTNPTTLLPVDEPTPSPVVAPTLRPISKPTPSPVPDPTLQPTEIPIDNTNTDANCDGRGPCTKNASCKDKWCVCDEGYMADPNLSQNFVAIAGWRSCKQINECVDPSLNICEAVENGGTCVDYNPPDFYKCLCMNTVEIEYIPSAFHPKYGPTRCISYEEPELAAEATPFPTNNPTTEPSSNPTEFSPSDTPSINDPCLREKYQISDMYLNVTGQPDTLLEGEDQIKLESLINTTYDSIVSEAETCLDRSLNTIQLRGLYVPNNIELTRKLRRRFLLDADEEDESSSSSDDDDDAIGSFLVIEETTLFTTEDSGSNETNTTSNVTFPAFSFDFTLWFRILHRCLGCPNDFNLFDDASRRRRQLQKQQENDVCVCDEERRIFWNRDLEEGTSPRTTERDLQKSNPGLKEDSFVVEFNKQNEEKVVVPAIKRATAVIATSIITESPSSSPSKSFMPTTPLPSVIPSMTPSMVPTSKPSSLPSIHPTLTASETPTDQPSDFPSQTPTLLPTKIPTSPPQVDPTFPPTPLPTKIPTSPPQTTPTPPPTPLPTNVPPTPLPTPQPITPTSGSSGYGIQYYGMWPHCRNIRCHFNTNVQFMMGACNESSSCDGFSFSASSQTGWGCTKICGDAGDGWAGYGYNTHDYWKKGY